jgi:hypothetical protein
VPPLPSQPAPPTNIEVILTPVDGPPSLSVPPAVSVPQHIVVPESLGPISPAVSYVARRERYRRNRVTMAVCLLVAVIVLAAVLVWVLQRRPNGAGEKVPATTSEYDVSTGLDLMIAAAFDSNPLPKQVTT